MLTAPQTAVMEAASAPPAVRIGIAYVRRCQHEVLYAIWSIALAVTAGIAEETARYLVYQRNATLRDTRNWHVAVVTGAAHGGVESIVLGVQALLGLIVTFYTPEPLPSAFATPPSAWSYVLGTVARVLIIIGHIGFALLVWRAVGRQRIGYYLAAVLSHIVIDLITFCQPILLPGYDWISYITLLTFCLGVDTRLQGLPPQSPLTKPWLKPARNRLTAWSRGALPIRLTTTRSIVRGNSYRGRLIFL
jgi:hypothetical protein